MSATAPILMVRAALLLPFLALTLAAQGRPVGTGHSSSSPSARMGSGKTGPAASRNANAGRPADLPPRASNNLLNQPAMVRWTNGTSAPNPAFWQQRDLFVEIRTMARQGFIPVVPVDVNTSMVSDFSYFPSGWKGYAFAVPAKENLHVRLHQDHEGWFRLVMCDRWGQMRPGMLQNLHPTGNPEVTFNNLGDQPQVVYVIVDDPGWMSSQSDPFVLKVDRSWEPAKKPMGGIPSVLGVWAVRQPKPAEPEPAAKPEPAAVPAAPAKS